MDKRLGFVGIIIEDRQRAAPLVNEVLTSFGECIVARTGIPLRKQTLCVITLIVDATTDQVGEMTGRLGKLPGVSVKSALSKPRSATS